MVVRTAVLTATIRLFPTARRMCPSLVRPWKLDRLSLDRADRPAGAVITSFGWKARSTDHSNGTTKTTTPMTAASTYRVTFVLLSPRPPLPPGADLGARVRTAGRSTVVAICSAPSVGSVPLAQEPELARADERDDDDEDDRQRRRGPDLQLHEGPVVDVEDDRCGRPARSALGEDVELGERQERADHGEDHAHPDRAAQQRDRDVELPPPPRGAVQLGGLVELARDALHPGDHEHHGQPGDGPDHQEADESGGQ